MILCFGKIFDIFCMRIALQIHPGDFGGEF
jgi:hypothetical protein